MGICLSTKDGSSVKTIRRSNKIKDASSFTTKDNQPSGSGERKPDFNFTRDEAENLLVNAVEGTFLLSKDVSSERFISVCSGQYVAHHAIFSVSDGILVGGEYFESISEMLEYFKEHPLGKVQLCGEYTTSQYSSKRDFTSKNSTSKSESSLHITSVASPEHFSEQSEHRALRKFDSTKSDIQPLPEEEAVPAEEMRDIGTTERRDSRVKRKSETNSNDIEATVSSAGYKDLPMGEPVPVLPEQDGERPPPLFKVLSSKSLSGLGFHSFGHNIRMSAMKYPSFEPNGNQLSCLSTRMIKIIVCGKPDTTIEQEYLSQDCLPVLSDFCNKFGFVCDVTHLTHSRVERSMHSSSWVVEDAEMGLTNEELTEIQRFGIPVLLLGCFGEKMGPTTIPSMISCQDFDRIETLLTKEMFAKLKDYYEVDENDTCRSFILKKNVEKSETMDELINICKVLLLKCFEGEKDLWKNFQPETERHMKKLLSELNNLVLIPIERTITDLRKCERSTSLEPYEDDQDGNSYYQLESMRNEFRKTILESAELKETDVITLKTNVMSVKKDEEERRTYVKMLANSLLPHIKRKLVEIMQRYPALGSTECCLRDEIFTHLFECRRKSKEFVGHTDVLGTVKAYLQGPYSKPLILHGESGCGRASVVAKSSELTKEWVGNGTSIITRFIGSTRDSSSLHLLLQSICLQLSYAYKTDPAAVPQNLTDVVQFLPNLFQFATDAQPLVIFIAALDEVEIFDDELKCFCFIPPILQSNVKIVITINKTNLKSAQQIYTDVNSYREIPTKTTEDGIEMLDSMLVAADRTLSEQQKAAISKSLSSCWSPVYVNILFHKAKSWRGNEHVNLPSQVDLTQYMNDIFLAMEKEHGYDNVCLISSLISVSQFGISKRSLCNILQQKGQESAVSHSKSTKEVVTDILKSFASIVSMKWLNGQVVCTWFHQFVQSVVTQRYLMEQSITDDVTSRIVYNCQTETNVYESLETANNCLLSSEGDLSDAQISMSDKRRVSELSNHHKGSSRNQCFNLQRLHFLPLYLLRCSQLVELKKHALCNYDFLHDKLRATSVGHLLNDYYYALSVYSNDLDLKILREFFELSTDALALDPDQLSAQIFARLHQMQSDNPDEVSNLRYASEVEKKMLPPPDGKDSTSSEGSDDEDLQRHAEAVADEIRVSDNSNLTQQGNSSATTSGPTNEQVSSSKSNACNHSLSPESFLIAKLVTDSVRKGHLLMPSKPCLIRPASECGAFPEKQMSSILNKSIDTHVLFLEKQPDAFITWSRSQGTIAVYNARCICLQKYKNLAIKQVILTVNNTALVEMHNGKIHMFDFNMGEFISELDSENRYFAVCDSSHVAALSDNFTCLNVYNFRSRQVVWDYRAPEGRHFHNILISKNGAIGACILEADSYRNSREDLSFDKETDMGSSMQDEITVVNLKSRQQLHSVSLKNGQFFHKICAISEDGHYLVHLTEPDYQILVLDLMKGVVVHEMDARLHRILKILVSTQGNCILSASADSVLRVWNLSDGDLRYSLSEPIRSIRGGYMDDKHCLSMSEDGSRAVHSVRSQFHYSYVVLWDLVQGQQLATFTTDFYGLTYQISPGGDYVVSSMPSGIMTMGVQETMIPANDVRLVDEVD